MRGCSLTVAGGGSGGCKAAVRAGQCTICHLLSAELLDLKRSWRGMCINGNKGRSANSATRAVLLPPQPADAGPAGDGADPSRYFSSAWAPNGMLQAYQR